MKEIIEVSMFNDRGYIQSNMTRHQVKEETTLWDFVKSEVKGILFGETPPESQEEMELEIKGYIKEGLIDVEDDKVMLTFHECTTVMYFL